MDGRPPPSKYAPHSHGGFTTGTWEGDTLTAVTTHFKMGDIKRHRAFSSDRATLTYRFNRHGDLLTVTGILEDPVYLAEPYVLTEIFRSRPASRSKNCRDSTRTPRSCRTICRARIFS